MHEKGVRSLPYPCLLLADNNSWWFLCFCFVLQVGVVWQIHKLKVNIVDWYWVSESTNLTNVFDDVY